MTDRNHRLASLVLPALALVLVACSFGAASALAGDVPLLARWSLVAAAGGCGATAHRLAHRPVPERERIGFAFGAVAALSGALLFGSAALFGTPTDPVRASVPLRAVACLSFGTLLVATVATVAYLVGTLRRRESPEQRADRISEQVLGSERF
ncbi:hypothetical protein [Halomarina rubra]|uniref:Uncharacterized protein n=1 Tax=Halomarina rubra TaxID=2071873 RepID=A0ABD6B097_9EURY|nr:hypothetical protein [Halomarina rubra]